MEEKLNDIIQRLPRAEQLEAINSVIDATIECNENIGDFQAIVNKLLSEDVASQVVRIILYTKMSDIIYI